MADSTLLESLSIDSFTRIRELVTQLTDGLSDELARYRPDEGSNSIAWLIWHLTRIQDDHLAGLAGVEQAWPSWRDKFALPFDQWATGYGQTAAEVAAVRVSPELLAGYHAAVHELTLAYLDGITEEELARVVDTRWDPPVTAAVRLVSVLSDALQHLGQADYVRGLAERHHQAWRDPAAADR